MTALWNGTKVVLNATYRDNDYIWTCTTHYTWIFYFGLLLINLTGVSLNIFILAVSLVPRLLRGEYRYFILNLALIEILRGVTASIINTCQLFPTLNQSATFSYLLMFIGVYGIFGMIFGAFPILLSRFVAVCIGSDQYRRIYVSKVKIALWCIGVDSIPAVLLILVAISIFCTTSGLFVVIVSLMLVGLVLCCVIAIVVFSFCIFCKMHRHISVVRRLDSENDRLVEDVKGLTASSLVQAILPLLLHAPYFVLIALNTYVVGLELKAPSEGLQTYCNILSLSSTLGSNLNPLVDSIITITVVRNYRRATNRLIAIYSKKHKESPSVRNEVKADSSAASLRTSIYQRVITNSETIIDFMRNMIKKRNKIQAIES